MLDARGSRDGMLKEGRGMENRNEESWGHVRFRTQHQQFSRTDSRLVSEHGFVEIRTEFPVQHITGLERRCSASHVRCLPAADATKPPGDKMFKAKIESTWTRTGLDRLRDQIAQVRKADGRALHPTSPLSRTAGNRFNR